jgi:multidrug resistance efflux pump
MRKTFFFIFVSLIGILSLSACSTPTAQAAATPAAAAPSVIAEGVVKPVRTVDLGFFPSGGIVGKVDKTAGASVQQGEEIASLTLTEQQSAAVASAQQELVLAQNALQNFLDEADVSKAQAAHDLALANETLNDASDKKRDKEYTYKYSKTRESKIELDKAQTNFTLAQAQVALAQARVDKWKDGPDKAQLAELKARVANAEAQLASAKAQAGSQLQLIAPWAGTVIENDLVDGQTVQAGQSYVKLADTSAWIVETSDLKETDIAGIKVGDSAKITVDALPGKEMTGKVTDIEGIGVDKQGDITYKVTLAIAPDPQLLWNMTASVEFAK